MKKIIYQFFLVGSVVLIGTSCKKNITDLNTDPTLPSEMTSAALFSNASVNISDLLASTNVNTNNFRLFAQYWTETIYRDETRYNLNQRSNQLISTEKNITSTNGKYLWFAEACKQLFD